MSLNFYDEYYTDEYNDNDYIYYQTDNNIINKNNLFEDELDNIKNKKYYNIFYDDYYYDEYDYDGDYYDEEDIDDDNNNESNIK